MFDTYMDAHALDPRMRRRMTLAMGAAVLASALAISTYSGVERMSISRVGAPQVEMDFLMATTVASPTAAPPPPPPQQVPAVAPTDEASADDPEPTRTTDDFDDVLESPRKGPDHRVTSNPGPPGGIPGPNGGPPTIGMPCIGGNCTIGVPPATPRLPPVVSDTAKVPLSVIEGRVRFSPDPPREELGATRAGQLRRGGTSVVEFCVGTDGKVERASTKRSAGDGDVDRICRDTLKRWRFSPLQVQGRATRMCSEMSFVIAFE